MKLVVAGRLLAVLLVACCVRVGAQQGPTTNRSTDSSHLPTPPAAVNTTNTLSVPAGESLVVELKSPLNSRNNRKGDHAHFSTTSDVLVGDQIAIPRGTTVRAKVTRAKAAGALRKAQLQFEFNEIVLPDGGVQPLSANLSQGNWRAPRGEFGKGQKARTIMSDAASGAIMGVIFAGTKGAMRGAAAGGAVGAIGVLMQHGPDLDFPPGMMFEIELTKRLTIPLSALPRSQIATSQRPHSPASISASAETRTEQTPSARRTELPPDLSPSATSDSKSKESTTVAANRTRPPVPPTSMPPGVDPGGFKLKVDVDLVVVEATVRDERGGIVDNLKKENFHLFEDGVEQQISHFSRDELPLAVALVVDRSGSMGPVIEELRRAAYDTLSMLKPDDQVALFAFAATPERLEYLTTDRKRIAEDIAEIRAGGGTNITDALFQAALYLSRAAPDRRHAVILVSDNEPTVRGYASDSDVIRLGLETESAIYSIKVGGGYSRMLSLPLPALGMGSVPKIARQTGGELIDANSLGSVQSAMATVISRLKQRYSLGYHSANPNRDGSFRQIEIRVTDAYTKSGGKYSVFARHGYYARKEQTARGSR